MKGELQEVEIGTADPMVLHICTFCYHRKGHTVQHIRPAHQVGPSMTGVTFSAHLACLDGYQ